jgi:hypothetical protein
MTEIFLLKGQSLQASVLGIKAGELRFINWPKACFCVFLELRVPALLADGKIVIKGALAFDSASLMRIAEERQYEAKAGGRNRVC